jgi:hypothetical protein
LEHQAAAAAAALLAAAAVASLVGSSDLQVSQVEQQDAAAASVANAAAAASLAAAAALLVGSCDLQVSQVEQQAVCIEKHAVGTVRNGAGHLTRSLQNNNMSWDKAAAAAAQRELVSGGRQMCAMVLATSCAACRIEKGKDSSSRKPLSYKHQTLQILQPSIIAYKPFRR